MTDAGWHQAPSEAWEVESGTRLSPFLARQLWDEPIVRERELVEILGKAVTLSAHSRQRGVSLTSVRPAHQDRDEAKLTATALRPFAIAALSLLMIGALSISFCPLCGFLFIALGLMSGVFMCQAYETVSQVEIISWRAAIALHIAIVGWLATALVAGLMR